MTGFRVYHTVPFYGTDVKFVVQKVFKIAGVKGRGFTFKRPNRKAFGFQLLGHITD